MSAAYSHFELPGVVAADTALQKCVLRGSLDPATGMFYRAPERARIRTAQACDMCRIRKAKCSGDHPICDRCRVRGLACQYALERRPPCPKKSETVLDRSTRQTGPSNGTRSRTKGTSAAHGPPAHSADVERPENGIRSQRTPSLREEVLSTAIPSTSQGIQIEQSPALDAPPASAVEPCRTHHQMSHGALFEGPSTSFPDDDFLTATSGFTRPGYFPVEGAQTMMSSPYLKYTSCLYVPSAYPVQGQSPGCTPSTSASASPVLTRPSSNGPPVTPRSSYPSSPFALASYSPHLTSYAAGSHTLFPLVVEDGVNADIMGDYVTLNEIKTSAADLGMFLDLDNVF